MTWVRLALSGPSLSTFTVRRIDLTSIVKPGIFIVDDVALPPPITFLVLPGEKAITAKLGGGGLDLASGGPSVGGREAQYSLQKYAPSPLYHASRWPFLIGNWLPQNLQRSRAITITFINVGAWSLLWNKTHSTRSTKGEGQQLQGTGRRPAAIAGTTDSRPSTLERYDESAFCCSRVGHAACQPDLRSDRQQSDLWRLRLGTKLPLLWCESITRVVRGWVSRNTHDSVGIVRTK